MEKEIKRKNSNKSSSTKSKTTTKKTTTSKKSTSTKPKTSKKASVRTTKYDYSNPYNLTDFLEIGNKKEETKKIDPKDVVIINDKPENTNKSIEDKLDIEIDEEEKTIKVEINKIKETIEEVKEKTVEISNELRDDVNLLYSENIQEQEHEIKPKEKKKLSINFSKIITVVLILIIIYATLNIVFLIFEFKSSESISKNINKKYTYNNNYTYEVDFKKLKKINKDTVGYLKIKNIGVESVVVKGKDNDYYLKHNFYNKKSTDGWVFMDCNNDINKKEKQIIIYGKNGSMFGELKGVLKSNWQKNKDNQIITLVTEKGVQKYKVFSTYKTTKVTIDNDFKNKNDYDKYLNRIKSLSNYNYNTNVNKYDSILTIATTGRIKVVLHAKLMK